MTTRNFCHLLSFMVTLYQSLYRSLSLIVSLVCHLLYHLLSFVVTYCTTCCQSLSLVVNGCITRLCFYKQSSKHSHKVIESIVRSLKYLLLWLFIKIQRLIHRVTTSDNEWQQVVQQMANEGYIEWQRVVQRLTTSNHEWQRVTKNYNEWSRGLVLLFFSNRGTYH